jgi:hypothetical protein
MKRVADGNLEMIVEFYYFAWNDNYLTAISSFSQAGAIQSNIFYREISQNIQIMFLLDAV